MILPERYWSGWGNRPSAVVGDAQVLLALWIVAGVSLQHGHSYGGWDLIVGLGYQKSHGDSNRVVERDLQSTLDEALGTNASQAPGPLRTGYEVVNGHAGLAKGNWAIRLWGWTTMDHDMGDGVTQILAPRNSLDSREVSAELSHDNKTLLPDTTFSTRFSYNWLKSDYFYQLFPAGAVLPIGADGNISFTNIANYDLVNLVLRRQQIVGHWDAAVAVRNLFDEDAREPSQSVIPNDYPLAGRSFSAELRCAF